MSAAAEEIAAGERRVWVAALVVEDHERAVEEAKRSLAMSRRELDDARRALAKLKGETT